MEALSAETREHVDRIGAAKLVLGVPTYNNRETIGRVTGAGLAALANGLPSPAAIVNADGASKDGTPEYLRELVGDKAPLIQVRYPVYPARKLAEPLAGVPGRQEAATTIFAIARQLGASACVLVDADLEEIGPEWVARLASPVLDHEIDLLAPCYLRHKFDGLIGGGLVSPFTRALYGKRLRQTAGADLAFSARLMDFHLARQSDANAAASLDPWSAETAIAEGFRLGQTFLGPRSVHTREMPDSLSGTLSQVLNAVFRRMESSALFWQKVRGSEPVPWFGPPLEVNCEPAEINQKRMVDSFRLGCETLTEIWNLVLPPATLLELRKMLRSPEGQFRFRDETWARTVYDFALAYHLRTIGRDHLLQAITPLYLGWVASFVGEMQTADADQVEQRLEQLSLRFEAEKKYLISRWRWPDRFNP